MARYRLLDYEELSPSIRQAIPTDASPEKRLAVARGLVPMGTPDLLAALYYLPGACSLLLFAWLLSFHPVASGRVYAAYGGVYVLTALVWLRIVDGIRPVLADYLGAGLILLGALVIVAHHWPRLEPH